MRFICTGCAEGDCGQCRNVGKDTNTWCDCQHKGEGQQAAWQAAACDCLGGKK